MRPDLTVSVISADNLELLLPCLGSVFENTHRLSLEVYLVDNASTDGTAAAVEARFPQVEVVCNEERLGFSTNNNLVLGQGEGRYLMLLNDDTLVLDGALDSMVEFMDMHPEVGAVGSYLLNADGSPQLAFARFPHPLFDALWPTKWAGWGVKDVQQPFDVDCVSGAALVVRPEIVEVVGVLDTDFDPIYSEEIDWCYRIKQAGWAIYTLPQARIVHFGSQTMNRVVLHKYELLLSHKMLFFRKHCGSTVATVYRVTLGFSTMVKFMWWTVTSLLPAKREIGKERRALHWHILRRIPSW